jgi:hypothetical protein
MTMCGQIAAIWSVRWSVNACGVRNQRFLFIDQSQHFDTLKGEHVDAWQNHDGGVSQRLKTDAMLSGGILTPRMSNF